MIDDSERRSHLLTNVVPQGQRPSPSTSDLRFERNCLAPHTPRMRAASCHEVLDHVIRIWEMSVSPPLSHSLCLDSQNCSLILRATHPSCVSKRSFMQRTSTLEYGQGSLDSTPDSCSNLGLHDVDLVTHLIRIFHQYPQIGREGKPSQLVLTDESPV